MNQLLTAMTKDGQVFSLVEHHHREELMKLRKEEQFFCPVCHSELLLKIGSKKIPHFAHVKNSHCTDSYDRESEYHLQGKLHLYYWLTNLSLTPQLEAYFPNIGQRADVAFHFDGKMYAIEFQCSPISQEVFIKRTKGYRKAFITPLWILGSNHIKRLKRNKVSLSSFHYSFMKHHHEQFFLPTYCPEKKQFIILEDIVPLSTQISFCTFQTWKLETMTINKLLEPNLNKHRHQYMWLEEMFNIRKKIWFFRTPSMNQFIIDLYHHSLNPHFLPPYLGLPIINSHFIETHPLLWQTYLFLDYLQHPNKRMTNHDLKMIFLKRVKEGKIKLRRLPQVANRNVFLPLYEFLHLLLTLGIVREKNEHIYEIEPHYLQARTIDDWEKQIKYFQHSVKKFGVIGMLR